MIDDANWAETIADLTIAVWDGPGEQARARKTILDQDTPWKIAALAATVAAVLDPLGGFRLARILSGEEFPAVGTQEDRP